MKDIKPKKIDRIILDPESMKVILSIMNQVQTELGDLVQINSKSIANFLIQERSHFLNQSELLNLKSKNYDIIKALKKATDEAIRLRQNGQSIEYAEILKILQTPSVIENQPTLKNARRNKKIKAADSLKHSEFNAVVNKSEEIA